MFLDFKKILDKFLQLLPMILYIFHIIANIVESCMDNWIKNAWFFTQTSRNLSNVEIEESNADFTTIKSKSVKITTSIAKNCKKNVFFGEKG